MTSNNAGGGDGEALLGNTNNPDICVTNVIGDEVLLLGGGKSTPSSSTAALSTETSNPSYNLLSSVASPLNTGFSESFSCYVFRFEFSLC